MSHRANRSAAPPGGARVTRSTLTVATARSKTTCPEESPGRTVFRRYLQGGLMPTPIDRDEAQRLLAEEDGQLVEVLPPDEYEDEHLPGAINIPLKTLDAETTRRLERGRPVIVYCHDYQ